MKRIAKGCPVDKLLELRKSNVTYAEIARQTGVPLSTVFQKLRAHGAPPTYRKRAQWLRQLDDAVQSGSWRAAVAALRGLICSRGIA